MDITVKEVACKKELKEFVLFPHSLYSTDRYWVPPLIFDEIFTLTKSKNPAFEYCQATYWLAYRNKRIVGRVAGIINTAYIEKWGKRYARFGWLDFIEDESVSKVLMETVEQWALSQNMTAIQGPLGFTDFDPEGLLIEGFDILGTMTTLYNYPYYSKHLEKLWYQKDVDWVELEVTVPDKIPDRVNNIANFVSRKYQFHILKARTSTDLLPFATGIFDLINESYAQLYGVVSLSKKQIDAYIKQFFVFINPEYVSIILHQGSVVAFAITMPSLSIALKKAKGKLLPFGLLYIYRALRKNDVADLYLIAVRPDLQTKGVQAMLLKDLGEKFIKNQITRAITHPMLEENGKVLAIWKQYQTRIIKRRRCYIKFLDKTI